MRSLIIAFVFLVAATGALAQPLSDLAQQKLVGKVKSLDETSYRVKKVHEKEQQYFNAKTTDYYNEQGNKTVEYTYNPEGTLDAKSVFSYDGSGLLIQEDSYNPDGTSGFTNVYKYDRRGNMISVKLYDSYGNLFLETNSRYDANDNEIDEVNYSQSVEKDKHKDVILNKTEWAYNNKNDMIEERYYEGDSAMRKQTTFTYDGYGNKIEQRRSEAGMTLRTTYKYDAKGNIIEETQYDDYGKLAAKIITAYDENGNNISENYYDKDNNLVTGTSFQVTYDKNGNWIRKVQFDNNKNTTVTVREITYY